MSCPRPGCYFKGNSKYRTRECKLPNAWNEFQYLNAKRGWSPERLKREYWEYVNNARLPLKCDRPRNRLHDHQNNIRKIRLANNNNMCQYTNDHDDPEEVDS